MDAAPDPPGKRRPLAVGQLADRMKALEHAADSDDDRLARQLPAIERRVAAAEAKLWRGQRA